MHRDTRRSFIDTARVQEVILAPHAKIVITVNTAPKKVERAASANDNRKGDDSGVKRYREIIADNLKKRGWSLGWVAAVDSQGRPVLIADAHRGDGKRFVVQADVKLT